MCGVLGISSTEPVIGPLYNGRLTLPHRGQDSAIRSFCTACFSGKDPTGDMSHRYLEPIKQEREPLQRKQTKLALKF